MLTYVSDQYSECWISSVYGWRLISVCLMLSHTRVPKSIEGHPLVKSGHRQIASNRVSMHRVQSHHTWIVVHTNDLRFLYKHVIGALDSFWLKHVQFAITSTAGAGGKNIVLTASENALEFLSQASSIRDSPMLYNMEMVWNEKSSGFVTLTLW